jgi:diguanylate cyclase (GGDEF)-like protein/PAS domain S-box-containing protein
VNLTEKRAVEIRRVEAEERYRHTIEAANDAFVGVDDRGRITEWNAAAERMFGWSPNEILGQSVLETLIPRDRRDRYEQGLAHWADIVQAGHSLPPHWEMTVMHREGHTFIIEMSVVTRMDEQVRHLRAFVRDITARKAHEQRLAEQAVTDALTGLPDRTVMLDRLSAALVRLAARGGAVGVLFIDLDGFKAVNDDLGHAVGDQLLVSIADRLRAAVRPTDTVARIGGDEFAVVCGDLSGRVDAMAVADRVLAAFDAPLELAEAHHDVRVSIGIAVAGDPGAQPEELLGQADRAMYRAKRAGGHQAVVDEG